MMRRLAIALLAVTALASGRALASDYSHSCSTADGLYKMSDEELTEANSDKAIKYTTIKDTVLSQSAGYCLSKGQKFNFEAKSYVRKISFDRDGVKTEIELLCELASDGLPAAYTCEKEVVTLDSTTGTGTGGPVGGSAPASAASTAIWNHNGSVMRLDANGPRRVFSYQNPRPGMRKVGAKSGDVVFEGTREGTTYTGTAYVFSATCGRTGYSVAGNVSADERSVVVEGQVPLLDGQCKVTSYKRDTLRFDYVAR